MQEQISSFSPVSRVRSLPAGHVRESLTAGLLPPHFQFQYAHLIPSATPPSLKPSKSLTPAQTRKPPNPPCRWGKVRVRAHSPKPRKYRQHTPPTLTVRCSTSAHKSEPVLHPLYPPPAKPANILQRVTHLNHHILTHPHLITHIPRHSQSHHAIVMLPHRRRVRKRPVWRNSLLKIKQLPRLNLIS